MLQPAHSSDPGCISGQFVTLKAAMSCISVSRHRKSWESPESYFAAGLGVQNIPLDLRKLAQETAKGREKDAQAINLEAANENSTKLASELATAKQEAVQRQSQCQALQAELRGVLISHQVAFQYLTCSLDASCNQLLTPWNQSACDLQPGRQQNASALSNCLNSALVSKMKACKLPSYTDRCTPALFLGRSDALPVFSEAPLTYDLHVQGSSRSFKQCVQSHKAMLGVMLRRRQNFNQLCR